MRVPATLVASVGPGKRHGRSNSLKWPWLYDKLRAKGYDKSKAAAISNSRLQFRKKGRISVLNAKTAHKASTLRKIAAADKAGKHFTKGSLRASAHVASLAFACNDKSCAPPPVGTGGSKSGGGRSLSRRVGGGFTIDASGMSRAQIEAKIARIETAGIKTTGAARTLKALRAQLTSSQEFKVITAAEARGDSRPVSHEEFQRLANIGRQQLEGYAQNAKKIDLTESQWSGVKDRAYAEATKSWGGATIDLHTGRSLPQGVNAYAITVKRLALVERSSDKNAKGTVSVHENASKEEFNAAMELAKSRFGYTLARENHYLGVFHDDDAGRIDIDPVIVVSKSRDVETIGAASHSIGGAYNFKDGLGYWPPHVDTSSKATRKRDDYKRTYEA